MKPGGTALGQALRPSLLLNPPEAYGSACLHGELICSMARRTGTQHVQERIVSRRWQPVHWGLLLGDRLFTASDGGLPRATAAASAWKADRAAREAIRHSGGLNRRSHPLRWTCPRESRCNGVATAGPNRIEAARGGFLGARFRKDSPPLPALERGLSRPHPW